MITRNPNWSIEILWYETGYAKKKTLSPLSVLPEVTCIVGSILNCLRFVFVFYGLLIIFLALTLVNIRLWILLTLALVNIT